MILWYSWGQDCDHVLATYGIRTRLDCSHNVGLSIMSCSLTVIKKTEGSKLKAWKLGYKR